jgi:capsular exopolysaccharide synthesis family protein
MTREERNFEEEIDLRQLLNIIRKRLKWIISITIAFLVISALVSFFFLTPIYQASTTIMVNKAFSENDILNQIQMNDINVNIRLAETYSEIIKSRRVVSRVIEEMDLNMTYEGLKSITEVALVRDTELIDIRVQNPDPQLARDIANKLAEVFQDEVVEIMNVDNVKILDVAVTPRNPIKPNKYMNIAIAGVLGLMFGLGLAFALEFLDKTIKTPDDVKRHLGLSIIGAIPHNEKAEKRKIITLEDPKSPVSEAYRTLRTNLRFASLDKEIKTLVVTSAIAGEGKSMTTVNLATALAQAGSKVLLIDADFRRPSLHKIARKPNADGLADVLINKTDYRKSVKSSSSENLDLLFSGLIPPNPSELLSSKSMLKFIEETKEDYDYLIFDTPPVALVTDAAILSNEVDATILITSVGMVDYDVAQRAVELLENANANIIGSVLNEIPIGKGGYSYYKYYSSYYGEYEKTGSKRKRKKRNKEGV